jgi:hypothetical protein
MDKLTVAYGGMSSDYSAPGDRRRFAGFALRHNLKICQLGQDLRKSDVAVLTLGSDISRWKEIKRTHGKLVLDIVDSYIDESSLSPKKHMRGLYKSVSRQISIPHLRYTDLIKRVIANADLVVCASVEQQKRIEILNSNVHVIGDCFDELTMEVYKPRALTLGTNLLWEGMPDNLGHLKLLPNVNQAFNLTVVTSPLIKDRFKLGREIPTTKFLEDSGISCSLVPWTISNLKQLAATSTLAVIPISSTNSIAWRKSENKLLGLWSLGVPVLASPTPSYTRVSLEASLSNCLVEDTEWGNAVNMMSSNLDLMNQVARQGHRYASVRTASRVLDVLWKKSFESIGINI